jgi:ribonucleoside-triphosphate reductase (thioredoxin)
MLDNVIHFNGDRDARDMMSEAKFFEAYSRWDDKKDRYETWNDAVERVMNMHRDFYKDVMTEELSQLIDEAEAAYKDKLVLGAQRALQFGGEQLLRHQMRLYNCTSSYADRKEFFGEFFYILLCGAGAGVSVQKHHVAKLPKIQNRTKQAKIHQITDDIEGWATAADVLMSSYFIGGGKYPEYEGRRVYFDTSLIREKGSMISGGFKAPGPEPLRKALDKIEHLLQGLVLSGENTLRPIHVYDISMHLADAVLAGGVRRSATIFLFSPDDEEMMTAKTGDWYLKNPQRARSNNSALIVRSEATREYFSKIIESVKQFGEPGFVFADSKDHCVNPCVEIGMFPQYNGISGWQGCNLTELNGSMCNDIEAFIRACRSGAILGTLQAGYTDFKFVSDITKKIFDREALLGVSVTGWMNNPQVLLDEENLKLGATLVKQINRQVANLIGILPAARTTCVKPSGNASVLLKTASGVHGEHAPLYIRNVQMNKDSEVAQLIKQTNPYMVEESVWSQNKTDYVISFPVIAPKNSIFRDELYGTNLLDKVKLIQQNWVEYGTDVDLCVDPTVRHNVSNTISVLSNQWDEVEQYLFDNRQYFAGVSLLSASGDKDFNQAPNTEIMSEQEIISRYGRGSLFASGLIVDASRGFDNLWDACMIAQMVQDYGDKEKADLRAEWIRRFRNYAENYFSGDMKQAEYCLKAVHLLHRWVKIQQDLVKVDFSNQLQAKRYTDIDTMGATACAGGACEI